MQRNQMESFTEQTKMLLGHENSNINTLHKNIAFLQNELTEKNQILKFLMETQTAGLDVMKELRQQTNIPEQKIAEHLSQIKFNQKQRSETKIIQEKSNAKEISKLERKGK